MKLKIKYCLISLIIIIFVVFLLSLNHSTSFHDFNDVGLSSDYNDNWICTGNMQVTRSNEYTTLSVNESAGQYIAKKIIDRDCIIEWDNFDKCNEFDYCILTEPNGDQSNQINLGNDLGINGSCHVKLIISNNKLIPYVNNVEKSPISLKSSTNNGIVFRFNIDVGGNNINYNNFKIHE